MKTTMDNTGFVKSMREIRDKLSLEIMEMTFKQEKEYIKKELARLKLAKQAKQQIV